MKKYIGTKQVEAEPMNEYHAIESGFARPKEDDSEYRGGYHVVYPDGYNSWSPKDVFEEAYKAAETPLDRMKIELNELSDKMVKLSSFIGKEAFAGIDNDIKAMLLCQLDSMEEYARLLEIRFSRMSGRMAELCDMPFNVAISLLRSGFAIRRKGWNGKGLFVVKQIPAHIGSDVIPKMQSLPQSAKDLILMKKGFVDYISQCLIYNENTGRADSWVPSISDVFAVDWELVTV